MPDFEPQPTIAWYNYKTGAFDHLSGPITTDEQALLYLPQNEAAVGLYTCHRQLGLDIAHAMLEVLTVYVRGMEAEKK